MKKDIKKAIIYMFIIILFVFLVSIIYRKKDNNFDKDHIYLSNYLSIDEINYIFNNNIDIDEIKPYLQYRNFNIYHFYSYERLREDYNLTHLESINYYNNPHFYKFYMNPKPALFQGTSHILVNKCYNLDKNYVPKNLVSVKNYNVDYIYRKNEDILLTKEAMENYVRMYNDAKDNNIELIIFSGYRSYKKQFSLYYETYNRDDSISARPGFSEHQTGYAIDISKDEEGLTDHFKNTKSYEWLIQNSYKYGFILRYPEDKEDITGYQFEPWHFRYVGSIAADIYYQDITFEEYVFSNLEI